MSTPCVQEGRVASLETNMPHIMRRIDDLCKAVERIDNKLDLQAQLYAKQSDVAALQAKTEKLEHQWIYAAGFSAAIVAVGQYAISLLK
jgi:hypothetical protein